MGGGLDSLSIHWQASSARSTYRYFLVLMAPPPRCRLYVVRAMLM